MHRHRRHTALRRGQQRRAFSVGDLLQLEAVVATVPHTGYLIWAKRLSWVIVFALPATPILMFVFPASGFAFATAILLVCWSSLASILKLADKQAAFGK